MSLPKNPSSQPKVLFVDDEDSILSSAKRLFRGKGIELITASSPHEALSTLHQHDFDAVVSDFRMASMTGTEFLEKVKIEKPLTSRLLLTGYNDNQIIMDAVNRAAVFKFISKPWIDSELLLAVEAAVQHALRKKTNAKLIHEIGEQNQKLEVLSQNLESEVVSRTQSIEDSRSQAEIKERSVKELVAFVKNLSQVSTAAELYETINQEIWRYHGVLTLYFLFLHGAEKGKIYWTQSRTLHEKTVSPRASHFKDLNIRFNHQDDRQWWVESLKKEPIQLAAIPVRGRESNQNGPLALIFLDHNLKPEMLNQLMDRMTERLQVMTIVLDKILLAEQLIMATEQWQATFSAFSDPIAVVDNQENVIRANRTFYKDKKRQCYEMFDDREEICGGCPMPQATLTMEPATGIVQQSEKKIFRVNSYPVKAATRNFEQVVRVVNHYTDVTQERELYLKLVQSEKLAAVGLLAGNIAHELNNPLSGLRSMAQVLKSESPENSTMYQDLDEIEKASIRCQDIIRNVLSFSETSEDGKVASVDVNSVVEGTLPLLKSSLRYQSLELNLASDLPQAFAQPSSLQQVIFNLLNNACQAMPNGGVIVITTWKKKNEVGITIEDNGPGIPEDILKTIFEPFFTTKSEGQGTGLGLSISKGIIEKFKGRLVAESAVGKGTKFNIVLKKA